MNSYYRKSIIVIVGLYGLTTEIKAGLLQSVGGFFSDMNSVLGSGINSTGTLNKVVIEPLRKGNDVKSYLKSEANNEKQFELLNKTLDDAQYKGPTPQFKQSIAKEYDEHIHTPASVRFDSELCPQEQAFIKARYPYAHTNFKNLCSKHSIKANPAKNVQGLKINPPKKTPTIAVCASGGGFRAMMVTAAVEEALETTGLMDSVMFISVLSGSTWVTVPRSLGISLDTCFNTYDKYAKLTTDFIMGGDSTKKDVLIKAFSPSFWKKSIDEAGYLLPRDTPSNDNLFNEMQVIENNIMREFYGGQMLSAMDIYGAFISHLVLGALDDPTLSSEKDAYYWQPRQRAFFSQAGSYLFSHRGKSQPNYARKAVTKFPLPLATAVGPKTAQTFTSKIWNTLTWKDVDKSFQWFEFSPYEVGTLYYDKLQSNDGSGHKGAFVPTWAFGRPFEPAYDKEKLSWWSSWFKNGQLQSVSNPALKEGATYPSELPLGNFLATFGSAFAVSPEDIIRIMGLDTGKSSKLASIMGKMVKYFTFAATGPVGNIVGSAVADTFKQFRLFPFAVFNYMQFDQDAPCKDDYLTLVDAGIDFNLPFPPLLRKERNVDVIITVDASSPIYSTDNNGKKMVDALERAQEWAERNNLKFPNLKSEKNRSTYEKIFTPGPDGHVTQDIFIFDGEDGDVDVPMIIYVPLLDNTRNKISGFRVSECMENDCNTFNFGYSKDAIEGARNLVFFTIKDNIKTIIESIAEKGHKKYSSQSGPHHTLDEDMTAAA